LNKTFLNGLPSVAQMKWERKMELLSGGC